MDGQEVRTFRYVAFCEEISGMVCDKRFAQQSRQKVLGAAMDHLESGHGLRDVPWLREDIQMLIYDREKTSPPMA